MGGGRGARRAGGNGGGGGGAEMADRVGYAVEIMMRGDGGEAGGGHVYRAQIYPNVRTLPSDFSRKKKTVR